MGTHHSSTMKKAGRRKKAAPVEVEEAPEPEPTSGLLSDSESDDEELEDDEFSGAEDMSSEEEDDGKSKGFSDANKSWLKPAGDSETESESDDEEELEIEKQSHLLEEAAKKEQDEAEQDLDEELKEQAAHVLPEEDDVEQGPQVGPQDTTGVKERIQQIVNILGDFKKLRADGKTRVDYTRQLRKDLCLYYSYSDLLVDAILSLFSAPEAMQLFEANETERPLTIRVNTLKARRRDVAQALINRGVNLDPLAKWSKVGLRIVDSTVPIGATPEYLAGHYILQSASSFLPCISLAPLPGEKVLDMASAPGGKTTYLAALMKNGGNLFANDFKKERVKGLVANIHRLGVRNTIVLNHDGRDFPKVMGGFDRILLDAPCSGTGVIAKDHGAKQKLESEIKKCSHLQRELLLAAVDSIDVNSATGGYVVYSTCSMLVEENEAVLDYVLKNRCVKLVETGLEFGVKGRTKYKDKRFHPSVELSRRFYPHVHNMDGFFMSKLKKYANGKPKELAEARAADEEAAKGKKKRKKAVEEEEEEEEEEEAPPAKKATKAKAVKKKAVAVEEEEEEAPPAKKATKAKAVKIAVNVKKSKASPSSAADPPTKKKKKVVKK